MACSRSLLTEEMYMSVNFEKTFHLPLSFQVLHPSERCASAVCQALPLSAHSAFCPACRPWHSRQFLLRLQQAGPRWPAHPGGTAEGH